MKYLLLLELIGYYAIILHQRSLYRQGKLTANYFALLQVAIWNLMLITGAFALSESFNLWFAVILLVISIIGWVIGYPFARWLYKQLPPR
jgi:hypothetical protein